MTNQPLKPPITPDTCPVYLPVSYFGAEYTDTCCIDGELWDLDSCDEPGGLLSVGGDIPCPFCKPTDHAEYMKNNDDDQIVCEACKTVLSDLKWTETQKPSVKLYGFCHGCNCLQWADVLEAEDADHD